MQRSGYQREYKRFRKPSFCARFRGPLSSMKGLGNHHFVIIKVSVFIEYVTLYHTIVHEKDVLVVLMNTTVMIHLISGTSMYW